MFGGLESIGLLFIYASLFPFLLLGLAIPYAILKARDGRLEDHDPEIGLKAVLYFLFSLAILLVLLGLTIIVIDALVDRGGWAGREFSTAQRTGAGLVLSGFAIAVFHVVLIFGFTNDRRYPDTRRMFVGWRFAIHGLVTLTAFTMLVVQVFQKDVDFESLKPTLGTLLVWTPSWLLHLILLYIYRPAPVRVRLPGERPFAAD
jgi:hypothetical protein